MDTGFEVIEGPRHYRGSDALKKKQCGIGSENRQREFGRLLQSKYKIFG
jgi:hypothetical protein